MRRATRTGALSLATSSEPPNPQDCVCFQSVIHQGQREMSVPVASGLCSPRWVRPGRNGLRLPWSGFPVGPARRALGRWELPAAARALAAEWHSESDINAVMEIVPNKAPSLSLSLSPSLSMVCCVLPRPRLCPGPRQVRGPSHASSSWASEGRSNAAAGHWQLFHLHAAGPGSLTWLHREAVTL